MAGADEVWDLAADLAAAPAKVTAESITVIADNARETQRDAQHFAPVLTGRLHDSITITVYGLLATVSTDLRYAGYVEHGTSDTPAQPYMRPAAELAGPRLADDLGDIGEDIL